MKTILLLLAVTAPLAAATWTSTTGHTIEADLVAKTETTASLKKPDGQVVTVPLDYLDDASRKAVADTKVKVAPVIDAEKWKKLTGPLPTISASAPLRSDHNDLVQLRGKYDRLLSVITQNSVDSHLRIIRDTVEADRKRLEPISKTQVNPPRYFNGVWEGGSGAWKEVYAARASLSWLSQVEQRLKQIEAATRPVES